MLSQSAEENQKSSHDIEKLIKIDLKDAIHTYLSRYSRVLDQKLGLTREDLMNDIREQVWKGIITHNPSGKANLKTYLNTLIKNRFGVLFKRSTLKKNNMINYYADVYALDNLEEEHLISEETGETLFIQRQSIMRDLGALSDFDQTVYQELRQGKTLDEMEQSLCTPRSCITGAIIRIDSMARRRRRKET